MSHIGFTEAIIQGYRLKILWVLGKSKLIINTCFEYKIKHTHIMGLHTYHKLIVVTIWFCKLCDIFSLNWYIMDSIKISAHQRIRRNFLWNLILSHLKRSVNVFCFVYAYQQTNPDLIALNSASFYMHEQISISNAFRIWDNWCISLGV